MPVRPLIPELAEIARVELNEDPKRIESDLQHMKEWLDKQPHLRARKDDQWLIVFLRGCKYSLEKAKNKLDLYYSMRTLAPEFYSVPYNSDKFNSIMNSKAWLMLTKLSSPDAPRVSILRMGMYDPDVHKVADIFAVSIILQKIMLYEDDTSVVAGVRTIVDLEGVTMGHFLQMTPAIMKKLSVMTEEVTPARVKGTHFLNTPPGFETFFNTVKSLLNEKNRNRLFVHNKNYDELYKMIPKEILPAEYGGSGDTVDEIIDYWKGKVKQYSSWLEEDLKYGTDEQKRLGQPKSAETLFGVDGSFRSLEFD